MADDATQRPDPEVPERARRRTFTAKYKLEVLAAQRRRKRRDPAAERIARAAL